MKHCPHCDETRPVEDFGRNRNSSDGRSTYCLPCQREYHRAWRGQQMQDPDRHDRFNARKRADYQRRAAKRVETKTTTLRQRKISSRRFVRAIRLTLACTDCGWKPITDAEASLLHFDHTDPGHKIATGRLGRGAVDLSWTLDRIATEILDHCEPRCASCHAKRTAQQLREAWQTTFGHAI